jgi:hypothetical protein
MAASAPSQKCRYVIVTKDSARWLGIILDHYRTLGIDPFIMLDQSSDTATEALLKRRGVEFKRVHAELPRVETLIKFIPDHVDSVWAVRLDDDELPSRSLCEWIKQRSFGTDLSVIGFQRRWIRLRNDGSCEYSMHPKIVSRLGVLDAQWRMFRPSAVQYRSEIHTPGFYVPKGSSIAPKRAYIAHLSWLVRTASERRQQVEDYDRQVSNAGTRFRDVKVWEDGDVAEHDFRPMETDEFDSVAAALAATI